MARISLPTVLILALLTFAVCGAGLMCLELLNHYATLAGSIPVQALTLSVLLSVLLLAFPVLAEFIGIADRTPAHPTGRNPDIVPRMPLRLAFSDGILNTKAY